jgi:hypothetical protein
MKFDGGGGEGGRLATAKSVFACSDRENASRTVAVDVQAA